MKNMKCLFLTILFCSCLILDSCAGLTEKLNQFSQAIKDEYNNIQTQNAAESSTSQIDSGSQDNREQVNKAGQDGVQVTSASKSSTSQIDSGSQDNREQVNKAGQDAENEVAKNRDNKEFAYPKEKICDSRIALYKSYYSGMNRKILEADFGKKASSTVYDKLGFFATTVSSYDYYDGDNKTTPEVDFVFAQETRESQDAVLVGVQIIHPSPDVTINDLIEKYAKLLGIEKPEIKREYRKIVYSDEYFDIKLYDITCNMTRNGQTVKLSSIDAIINYTDYYNKSTYEVKKYMREKAEGYKETYRRKTIHYYDDSQVEAYTKLYKACIDAETKAEEARKQMEKKNMLDF